MRQAIEELRARHKTRVQYPTGAGDAVRSHHSRAVAGVSARGGIGSGAGERAGAKKSRLRRAGRKDARLKTVPPETVLQPRSLPYDTGTRVFQMSHGSQLRAVLGLVRTKWITRGAGVREPRNLVAAPGPDPPRWCAGSEFRRCVCATRLESAGGPRAKQSRAHGGGSGGSCQFASQRDAPESQLVTSVFRSARSRRSGMIAVFRTFW